MEKVITFADKIDIILRLRGLSLKEFEKKLGVDGTIYKAYNEKREPSKKMVTEILRKFHVKQSWWKSPEGVTEEDVFLENITRDDNEAAVAGKQEIIKALQDAMAEGSSYMVVPKTILDGAYMIFPKSEIEKQKKELEARAREQEDIRRERIETIDAKNKLIKRLEDEIASLRGVNPATPQDA